MEIGGVDTIIITTANPVIVIRRLLQLLVLRWPDMLLKIEGERSKTCSFIGAVPDVDAFSPTQGVTFVDKTIEAHVRNLSEGFVEDESGEGSLQIYYSRLDVFYNSQIIQAIESDRPPSKYPEPYETYFCLTDIWRITLVTVEDLEESKFSSWVFNQLIKLCSEGKFFVRGETG